MPSYCGSGEALESPLDSKEIKAINPKGNQPWLERIGRTDAEAPILWQPDVKRWLTGKKILMLGKIEGKRRSRWQRMRWLESITDSVDVNLSKFTWRTGEPGVLQSMRLQGVRYDLVTTTWIVYISSYCAKCYFSTYAIWSLQFLVSWIHSKPKQT